MGYGAWATFRLRVPEGKKRMDSLKSPTKWSDETSNAHSHINKEVGMNSMTVVKKGMSKGLAALLLAAAVTVVPTEAAIIAGGSVPLENYFTAVGNEGIDVRAVNVAMTTNVLGYIIINNNAPNSFVLTVTQRNGGFLRLGLAAALPVIATGTGNPFTASQFIHAQTPLGTEAEALTLDATVALPITAGVAGAGTLTGGAQPSALVDYMVEINGTWIAAPTLLAGYYTEVFTVSLVAVM
jgi:hypothetical protein